ncbi:hypothetical protein RND81_10G071600 [Saponaria officinalis]|uniref:Uncharacterized protein n=1 Tax=Saponaria officinalis TaxID=3572 RepID=A0AAW1I1K0_SAPOF
MYNYAAQYNGRFGHIHQLCRVLFRASKNDLLKGIGDAVLYLTQHKRCNDPTGTAAKPFSILDSASAKAWDWQRCNEIVPCQYCGENTMFEKSSFDPSVFSESCFEEYGSYSHPLWNSIIYNGRYSVFWKIY